MSRLPKSLAERGPRIERQPDGRDRWLVDGEVLAEWPVSRARAISNGDRYLDIDTWDQVPAASYDPAERLKAMDEDGIAAAVLYPYIAGLGGEILGAIKDPELQAACVDAYNDWLLETWSSDRLVPQALVPISSIEAARAGAVKAVKAGHKGIVLPAAPWRINDGTPHLYDPDWDLFWKQIGDLDVPICFHSGSVPSLMMHIYEGFDPAVAKAFDVVRRPSSSGMIVCRFLFSGVGERHPDVKFVFSATGIDWFAFMLEVSDHEWERICLKGEKRRDEDSAQRDLPSPGLRDNVVRPGGPEAAVRHRGQERDVVLRVPPGELDLPGQRQDAGEELRRRRRRRAPRHPPRQRRGAVRHQRVVALF